jgi:hypothetical protein
MYTRLLYRLCYSSDSLIHRYHFVPHLIIKLGNGQVLVSTSKCFMLLFSKTSSEEMAAESNKLLTYLLRGLSPQENYTDRATAACRRS